MEPTNVVWPVDNLGVNGNSGNQRGQGKRTSQGNQKPKEKRNSHRKDHPKTTISSKQSKNADQSLPFFRRKSISLSDAAIRTVFEKSIVRPKTSSSVPS